MEEKFKHLEDAMRAGFKEVADEVRLLRTDGMMPISLVEKILDKTDSRNTKYYDKLTLLFTAFILLLLGLKTLVPSAFGEI